MCALKATTVSDTTATNVIRAGKRRGKSGSEGCQKERNYRFPPFLRDNRTV
jgi:hypothetical protein